MDGKKTSPDRFGYLDFIRVFATVLVITLHTVYMYYNLPSNFGRPLWYVLGYVNELTRTAVPLFFMISGFLMLRRDVASIRGFYKKRFLKVAVPFLLYDVFYYLTAVMSSGGSPSFLHFLRELLIEGSAYHLWFVYSILFIYLLVPFLRKMVSLCTEKQLWFLLFLATFQTTSRAFLNLLLTDTPFSVYITSDGFTGYVGYVLLGYILGEYCNGRILRRVIYVIGALFFAAVPAVSMTLAVNGGEMILTGGYTINHYVEAAALFLWCKNHIKGRSKLMSKMSSVSFSAYLIHVFIVEWLRKAVSTLPPSLAFPLQILLAAVLSFLWGVLISYLTSALAVLWNMIKKKTKSAGSDSAQ